MEQISLDDHSSGKEPNQFMGRVLSLKYGCSTFHQGNSQSMPLLNCWQLSSLFSSKLLWFFIYLNIFFKAGATKGLINYANLHSSSFSVKLSLPKKKILTHFVCMCLCACYIQGNRHSNVLTPELVTSLKRVNERVVQISLTNSIYWNAHTFALTESGKLYAFGAGDKGQLGIELVANQSERGSPERVDIELN